MGFQIEQYDIIISTCGDQYVALEHHESGLVAYRFEMGELQGDWIAVKNLGFDGDETLAQVKEVKRLTSRLWRAPTMLVNEGPSMLAQASTTVWGAPRLGEMRYTIDDEEGAIHCEGKVITKELAEKILSAMKKENVEVELKDYDVIEMKGDSRSAIVMPLNGEMMAMYLDANCNGVGHDRIVKLDGGGYCVGDSRRKPVTRVLRGNPGYFFNKGAKAYVQEKVSEVGYPEVHIGEYKVCFHEDNTIGVGCQTITLEQVEKAVELLNA